MPIPLGLIARRVLLVGRSTQQIALAILTVIFVIHEIRKEFKAHHAWQKRKGFPRRALGEEKRTLDHK